LIQLAELPIPLPFSSFINRRSLLALDNLVNAVGFVLDNPATLNETYIVSDPEPVRMRDIIISLRARHGRKPWLFDIPPDVIERSMRLVGRQDLWERIGGSLVASSHKLVAAGWLPLGSTRTRLFF
jgi:UDP-glucose 4-epimerase